MWPMYVRSQPAWASNGRYVCVNNIFSVKSGMDWIEAGKPAVRANFDPQN